MRYTYVRQHDTTDCAAACLAMVCLHYKKEITITRLRDMMGTDLKGTNLVGLQKAANELGFTTAAVRVDRENFLSDFSLPCIAQVITDEGLQGKVIVTGLGLPSEMAEFMTGDNPACPYMFLWNPIDVGRSAAYALIEMVNGSLTGATGESFTAKNGTTYTVTDAGDGGTEIIIGPPFEFNGDNIEDWKTVY